MEITHAETYFPVDFEATGWGEEAEGRRPVRVGIWQEYAPVVDSGAEGRRRWGTAEGEVPFEEVGFQWCGVEVRGGVGSKLGSLLYCG